MFPIGTWASANPSLVEAMQRDGQIIDNHTATHADLSKRIEPERSPGDRPRRQALLVGLAPAPARRRRRVLVTRLTALAASRGYSLCFWTVDTRDWAGSSTAQMVRKVRTATT